jgi:hypothetical protein
MGPSFQLCALVMEPATISLGPAPVIVVMEECPAQIVRVVTPILGVVETVIKFSPVQLEPSTRPLVPPWEAATVSTETARATLVTLDQAVVPAMLDISSLETVRSVIW